MTNQQWSIVGVVNDFLDPQQVQYYSLLPQGGMDGRRKIRKTERGAACCACFQVALKIVEHEITLIWGPKGPSPPEDISFCT